MQITIQAFNFTPDAFELERMKKVAKTQDWDAGIDLCMRNILYDELRSMWVKCPEPDFDRRRSGGHDMETHYQDYLTHECRLMDGFPDPSDYSMWHCQFIHSLAQEPQLQGGLDQYGFVMELFDDHYTAQEAAEIFARATSERYSRLTEAREEEILSQFSRPLTGHGFLYYRDDIGIAIVNHRGGMKNGGTTTPEYRYADIYLKHYYPGVQCAASRADLHEIANQRYAEYMESTPHE